MFYIFLYFVYFFCIFIHLQDFYFKLFSLVKQFLLKQFSLAYVRNLDAKQVLFQAIQFSTSTQFNSIWAIDRVLSSPSDCFVP